MTDTPETGIPDGVYFLVTPEDQESVPEGGSSG